ncbi:flavodoxin family protein [Gorillibacterium timonense]|uniref:flavodoxin family protein n=1 Tax=Gorillibacterium timonense TaxID=1689269 RepID=UPI00071C3F66|nr:NAD(P)H-dependent oxidoreductase [Gorillibacterium timonense]
MKIAVLHGQMHRGSTYHLTHSVLDRLGGEGAEIREFFMPRDTPGYCVGCYKCFMEGEMKCPHSDAVQPIVAALEEADVIILDSPCYVFGMTGQLKTTLDHVGYLWMSHRPSATMFRKVGLVISTAAGAGASKVTKDLRTQLFFWGVPVIHRWSVKVAAFNWQSVKPETIQRIERKASKLAKQIRKEVNSARPGFKTRMIFRIMRLSQKGNKWNPLDREHWVREGWMDSERPW